MVPIHIASAQQQLTGVEDAHRLFASAMGVARTELIQVAYLDGRQRVLELVGRPGDPASVELPIAAILRRAVVLGARGIVLAHNHPSGNPTPSGADIEATRQLAETARNLNLRIYDHLVFAGERWLSFRNLGLL